MSNKRYPAERKEAILRKMALPMSMPIPELSEQEGISAATLDNWRKQVGAENTIRYLRFQAYLMNIPDSDQTLTTKPSNAGFACTSINGMVNIACSTQE